MPSAKFHYLAPESLDEAISCLSEHGEGAHVLAGGTDLLVRIRHGFLKPKILVSLKKLRDLSEIRFEPGKGLTIGALARLADVASHPVILKRYPAVAYAAGETANIQIRNMGTVVGNLCNAAPSADNAPTLIAMNAEARLAGKEGERRLSLDQFFRGPGLTNLQTAEIMTSVFVPVPEKGSGTSYQHLSARSKVDISAVGVGVMVVMKGRTCASARIALGAVAPVPLRARKTEKMLTGKKLDPDLIRKAALQAAGESRPISDVRASAKYRRQMVSVLTERAIEEATERAGK